MCLAIPRQLVRVEGTTGWAATPEGDVAIDLALVGPQPVGVWVMDFLGTARSVVDEQEAGRISKALEALEAVRQGGEVGDAFDDITENGPQLPPHLAAALASGRKTA